MHKDVLDSIGEIIKTEKSVLTSMFSESKGVLKIEETFNRCKSAVGSVRQNPKTC